MYKVKIADLSFYTEHPVWIRRVENGCFNLTDEAHATGICYGNTPYHLAGRPDLDGVETIELEFVDSGETLNNLNAVTADTDAMVVDYEYRLTLLELGIAE